jgi:hypothetical protein
MPVTGTAASSLQAIQNSQRQNWPVLSQTRTCRKIGIKYDTAASSVSAARQSRVDLVIKIKKKQ